MARRETLRDTVTHLCRINAPDPNRVAEIRRRIENSACEIVVACNKMKTWKYSDGFHQSFFGVRTMLSLVQNTYFH